MKKESRPRRDSSVRLDNNVLYIRLFRHRVISEMSEDRLQVSILTGYSI